MRVALVNTNRIKPPIAPIGLEYVAEALFASEHEVEVLDLSWEDDWEGSLTHFFGSRPFNLVGVTLRNTDDCAFASQQSFLPEFSAIVKTIQTLSHVPIIAGGVGFSVMPEQVLKCCGADAGVWSNGEAALVHIASRLEEKREWQDAPNLVWKSGGRFVRNPPLADTFDLPSMSRGWVDNRRYFTEGGQAGIETKRGCSQKCIYCVDPVAKGALIITRSPKSVVDEFESLLRRDIDCFHLCDSEFNIPVSHAMEVCREIIRRRLGGKIRWYTYCAPMPFSRELAGLMRHAGCVGINFGVDNGDEEMLKRLKRSFTVEDIENTLSFCKEAGITVMYDLLLGSPGETRESVIRTINLMKRIEPDQIGVAAGVRIYPGTEISSIVKDEKYRKGLINVDDPLSPTFFVDPALGESMFDLIDDLTGKDRRFFFFNPTNPNVNYNYNANQVLVEAIRNGRRGAYWDILRTIQE